MRRDLYTQFGLLITCCLISCLSFGQNIGVTSLSPAPTSSIIRGFDQIGTDTIVGVGDNNTIIRSVDGGVTWETLPFSHLNNTFNFYDVALLSSDTIFATDPNTVWEDASSNQFTGATLYTYDGGTTWTAAETMRGWDIKLVDENTWITAEKFGNINRTTDGGANRDVFSDAARSRAMHFVDDNTGYVAAQSAGSSLSIHKTMDGGQTWTTTALGLGSGDIDDVFFTSASTGYIVGRLYTSGDLPEYVLKTTDGGASFSILAQVVANTNDGTNTPVQALDYRIFFTDANTGFIAGKDGNVYRTIDAGANWTTISTGQTGAWHGLYFIDANNGFLSGENGFYSTSDAGLTWAPFDPLASETIVDIEFVNNDTVFAATHDKGIFRSYNAGSSWTQLTNAGTQPYNALSFVNETIGFAVGNAGEIRKTTDGGNNWTSLTSGVAVTLNDIHMVNADTGVAVGDGGTLLHTENGGASWTNIFGSLTKDFTSVDFAANDPLVGYAVQENQEFAGFSVVYRTTNGGKNWLNAGLDLSQIYGKIEVLSSTEAVVYNQGTPGQGGSAFYTNDAGANWTQSTIGFAFGGTSEPNQEKVNITSYNGVTFVLQAFPPALNTSYDGGETWTSAGLAISAEDIRSIAVQEGEVYIGGQGGTFVKLDPLFTVWDGSSWSNGVPTSTSDAVIEGNFNAATDGSFDCENLIISSGDTLFTSATNSVSTDNLINNGVIVQCDGAINATSIAKSGTIINLTKPTTPASGFFTSSTSLNSLTVNWTAGDGTKRIVFAREASAVSFSPIDGTSYMPVETDFSIAAVNDYDGARVVANGTDNNVTITGLREGTTYHFAIFEYNDGFCGEAYQSNNNLTGTAKTNPIITTWDGSSWSNGVPDDRYEAVINGNYQTDTHGDITASSMTINNGFVLTMHGAGSVVISHDLTANGNLENCANGTLTVGGTSSGNILTYPSQPGVVNSVSLVFSAASPNALHVNWELTAPTTDSVAFIVRPDAAVANNTLVDDVAYTADLDFSGTVASTVGTDGKVVFIGPSNSSGSFVVTGLDNNRTYHIAMIRFNQNNCGINYEPIVLTSDSYEVDFTSWNGSSWSNGVPDANTDAFIIDADYNTFEQGGFTARTSIVGTGRTLYVHGDLVTSTNYVVEGTIRNCGDGIANMGTKLRGSGSVIDEVIVDNPPTVEASNLIFSNILANSFQLDWSNGNGVGRIVVVKKGSSLDPASVMNQIQYIADTDLSGGGSVVDGTAKVVFNGTGNSVTITGLEEKTTYFVSVIEYNLAGCALSYLSTGSTELAQASLDVTPPSPVLSSSEVNPTNKAIFTLNIALDEGILGFDLNDFVVSNATLSNLQEVTNFNYTVDVTVVGSNSDSIPISISLPANAFTDSTGNQSNASNEFTIQYDDKKPLATFSSTTTSPSKDVNIQVTITFSEEVSNFSLSDLDATNAILSNLTTPDNISYTFDMALVPLQVAWVNLVTTDVVDAAGNIAEQAAPFRIRHDNVKPSANITTTANNPTNLSPIPFTITFTERVINTTLGSFNVNNGTLANLFTSDSIIFTLDVIPTADGFINLGVSVNSVSDSAGNLTGGASFGPIVYDGTPPTVSITTTETNPTNASVIPIEIVFSEPMIGFTADSITVENAAVSNLNTTDNTTFTADLMPIAEGMVMATIEANKVKDLSGNFNEMSPDSIVLRYDITSPEVVTFQPKDLYLNVNEWEFTVVFSEKVLDFTADDVTKVFGSPFNGVQSVTTNDQQEYIVKGSIIDIFNGIGSHSVTILPNAVLDSAGNPNLISADTIRFSYDDIPAEASIETMNVFGGYTNQNPIDVEAKFFRNGGNLEERAYGFSASDILVKNGTVANFSTSDSILFSFQVIPAAEGDVCVIIPDSASTDVAGNYNLPDSTTFVYDITPPTIVLSSTVSSPTNDDFIVVTATFSESVQSFSSSDFVVENATLRNFNRTAGDAWTVELVPAAEGLFSISLPADSFEDLARNRNLVSDTLSWRYDITSPQGTITTLRDTTNVAPIEYTISFTEPVFTLEDGDFTLTNATVSSLTALDDSTFTLNLTPVDQGLVEVSLAVGIALDSAENENNSVPIYQVIYDTIRPVLTPVTDSSIIVGTDFTVMINASEEVRGFEASDIEMVNASLLSFDSLAPDTHQLVVRATADSVKLTFPENIVADPALNGNKFVSEVNVLYAVPPVSDAPTQITSYQFIAHWNAVSYTNDYRIDVSTDSLFGSTLPAYTNLAVVGTQQLVEGLSLGDVYYYRIRADIQTAGLQSHNSQTQRVSLLPKPTATYVPAIDEITGLLSSPNNDLFDSIYVEISQDTFQTFSGFEVEVVGNQLFILKNLPENSRHQIRYAGISSEGLLSEFNSMDVFTLPPLPDGHFIERVTRTRTTLIQWFYDGGDERYQRLSNLSFRLYRQDQPSLAYNSISNLISIDPIMYHSYGDVTGLLETNSRYQIFVFNPTASNVLLIPRTITTGIEELNAKPINLYPNPTDNMLQLDLPDHIKTVKIRVLDAMGREVFKSEGHEISVGQLSSGVYWLQAEANGQYWFGRFVKR